MHWCWWRGTWVGAGTDVMLDSASAPATRDAPAAARERLRLLAVGDDPSAVSEISRWADAAGEVLTLARDSAAALRNLSECPWHAVLVTLQEAPGDRLE